MVMECKLGKGDDRPGQAGREQLHTHWHDNVNTTVIIKCLNQRTAIRIRYGKANNVGADNGEYIQQVVNVEADLQ